MRNKRLAVVAVGAMLAALPSPSDAQVGYLWTHAELLEKADVAVIAECVKTADTGRVRPHPGLTPALPVRELETTFRVSAILKGSFELGIGTDLLLRHYRYTADAERGGLLNAGSWLSLKDGSSYLLFLRRNGDDSYEPLSGHTFPDDSVYRLDKADGRL
jgi:hypothetical protein